MDGGVFGGGAFEVGGARAREYRRRMLSGLTGICVNTSIQEGCVVLER